MAVTVTDNLDGTLTIAGCTVTDNLDGTIYIAAPAIVTDNLDGTLTITDSGVVIVYPIRVTGSTSQLVTVTGSTS